MSMSPPGPTARPAMKRARSVLELNDEAGPEAARAAFLRRLAAEHFVPPEEWIPAVNTLTGSALPITPEAAEAEAAWLRDQVEAFAAIYWLLPPERRLSKWVELSELCREPFEKNRLLALERGLDVPVIPFADSQVDELARLLRELFVLTPRNRAIKRAAWLAEHDEPEERGTWREACRRLREESSATAGLEPEILRSLDNSARPSVLIEAPRSVPKSIDSLPNTHRDPEHFPSSSRKAPHPVDSQRAFHELQQRLVDTAATPSDAYAGNFVRAAIFIALLGGLKLVHHEASKPSESSDRWRVNNPSPPFNPRTVPSPNREPEWPTWPPAKLEPERPKRQYLEKDIREFDQYDPRSGKPPPTGYNEWKIQKLLEDVNMRQQDLLDRPRPTSR